MKPAKEWTVEIRISLGNMLRGDPVLTDGKSLIEHLVEAIQEDAKENEKPRPS